jgi:hypothetical protein
MKIDDSRRSRLSRNSIRFFVLFASPRECNVHSMSDARDEDAPSAANPIVALMAHTELMRFPLDASRALTDSTPQSLATAPDASRSVESRRGSDLGSARSFTAMSDSDARVPTLEGSVRSAVGGSFPGAGRGAPDLLMRAVTHAEPLGATPPLASRSTLGSSGSSPTSRSGFAAATPTAPNDEALCNTTAEAVAQALSQHRSRVAKSMIAAAALAGNSASTSNVWDDAIAAAAAATDGGLARAAAEAQPWWPSAAEAAVRELVGASSPTASASDASLSRPFIDDESAAAAAEATAAALSTQYGAQLTALDVVTIDTAVRNIEAQRAVCDLLQREIDLLRLTGSEMQVMLSQRAEYSYAEFSRAAEADAEAAIVAAGGDLSGSASGSGSGSGSASGGGAGTVGAHIVQGKTALLERAERRSPPRILRVVATKPPPLRDFAALRDHLIVDELPPDATRAAMDAEAAARRAALDASTTTSDSAAAPADASSSSSPSAARAGRVIGLISPATHAASPHLFDIARHARHRAVFDDAMSDRRERVRAEEEVRLTTRAGANGGGGVVGSSALRRASAFAGAAGTDAGARRWIAAAASVAAAAALPATTPSEQATRRPEAAAVAPAVAEGHEDDARLQPTDSSEPAGRDSAATAPGERAPLVASSGAPPADEDTHERLRRLQREQAALIATARRVDTERYQPLMAKFTAHAQRMLSTGL